MKVSLQLLKEIKALLEDELWKMGVIAPSPPSIVADGSVSGPGTT